MRQMISHDALCDFIEHAPLNEDGCPVELIINGDFFDFLLMPHASQYHTSPTNEYEYLVDPVFIPQRDNETDALAVFERLLALPEINQVLNTLKTFLDVDNHTLTILPGNHDIELTYPKVADALRTQLGGHPEPKLRILNHHSGLRIGDVWIEHGNQHDEFNRVNINDHQVFLDALLNSTATAPPIPPGSRIVARLVNPLKAGGLVFIDQLKPEPSAVRLAVALDMRRIRHVPDFLLEWARAWWRGAADQTNAPDSFSEPRYEPIITGDDSALDQANLLQRTTFSSFRSSLLVAASDDTHEIATISPEVLELLEREDPASLMLVGHTHLARNVERNGRRVINTGTWTQLSRLDAQVIENEDLWNAFVENTTATNALLDHPTICPQTYARVVLNRSGKVQDAKLLRWCMQKGEPTEVENSVWPIADAIRTQTVEWTPAYATQEPHEEFESDPMPSNFARDHRLLEAAPLNPQTNNVQRRGLFRLPFEYKHRLVGFVHPNSSEVVDPSSVKSDQCLLKQHVEVRFGTFFCASHPSLSSFEVLFEFQGRDYNHPNQDVRMNALVGCSNGTYADRHSFPVFTGLKVAENGLELRVRTIHINSQRDHELLAFFHSDLARRGLALAGTAQPLVPMMAELVGSLAQGLANRWNNREIHQANLGLGFHDHITGQIPLRHGTYLVLFAPDRHHDLLTRHTCHLIEQAGRTRLRLTTKENSWFEQRFNFFTISVIPEPRTSVFYTTQ